MRENLPMLYKNQQALPQSHRQVDLLNILLTSGGEKHQRTV